MDKTIKATLDTTRLDEGRKEFTQAFDRVLGVPDHLLSSKGATKANAEFAFGQTYTSEDAHAATLAGLTQDEAEELTQVYDGFYRAGLSGGGGLYDILGVLGPVSDWKKIGRDMGTGLFSGLFSSDEVTNSNNWRLFKGVMLIPAILLLIVWLHWFFG